MAMRAGQASRRYVHLSAQLTKKFQNLHFALALDADFEADLDDFAPLVAPTDVIRLGNLLPMRRSGCCKRPSTACTPCRMKSRWRCSASSAGRRGWCSISAANFKALGKLSRTERLHH